MQTLATWSCRAIQFCKVVAARRDTGYVGGGRGLWGYGHVEGTGHGGQGTLVGKEYGAAVNDCDNG